MIEFDTAVTSIGDMAFDDQSRLTRIILPNSVKSIEQYAFKDCFGLNSITIPNSVVEIEYSAFEGCLGLTEIVIPESTTSIDEAAFKGCFNLTCISVEAGNPVYDSREDCNAVIETNTNTLIIGCNSTVIPNTVTKIIGSAFDDCLGLTKITIPEAVKEFAGTPFFGCDNLGVIFCKPTIPPYVPEGMHWGYGNPIIYVPVSSLELYKEAYFWKWHNLQPYNFEK